MKWLKWLWAWFKRLFSRRVERQESVVPQYDRDTGELIVPKQLGPGNPSVSEQRLIDMSQDISNREAVLDAKLIEAQIEGLSAEHKLKERELEGKISNDQALIELEQKKLELEAEEMRRVQEREDENSRAQQQLEQMKAEAEEARKSNDQAEAFRTKRNEEKERARAAKAERRAQNQRARRRTRRVIIMRTKRLFGSVFFGLWSGIKFSFRKIGDGLSKKWVKPILSAIVAVGIGLWFFQTETGSQFGWNLLAYTGLYQSYVIGILSFMLFSFVAYWLHKSGKWPAVKNFLFRKAVLIPAVIIVVLSGVIWLYRQNYFDGWLSVILGFLWTYKVYAAIALTVVLLTLSVRWVRKTQARIDRFNDLKIRVQESGVRFWQMLSVTTAGVWAIALVVLAVFGLYMHSWLIFLTAIAWLPMYAGVKPSLSLSLRVIFGVLLQFTAITFGTLKLH